MRFSKRYSTLNSRKVLVDFGAIAVIALFFVAGIFFEARRGDDPVVEIGQDAEAVSVPTPSAATTATAEAGGAPVATAVPATVLPPTPAFTPLPAGTPDPEAVGQPVFLEISGIENESVVEASTAVVTGQTTPDALLSVNGEPVPVGLDGSFSIEVQLADGPNFIEFVASNLRGQEINRVFSLVSIQ